jgi:eukaryotic-like serine/threonine-protein kinase
VTIGHYRITGIIGRGGMGVVYEAEQEQPKRPVALKVINPGVTSEHAIRRFEHEAQILGLLQHSGIAQVYEAGTFDLGAGVQPFFAMEYVRGVPLTQYAERNKLSTHARLELIVKICRAVQHAHQKGVIHRDLKPGNILVTDEGEPKVLDFGVARATDSDIHTTTLQTDVGQLIGTIPYMSPEQAGGDPTELDTRSDVYALGVVAYELLAGRLPYNVQQKMVHEAVRIIREDEPTRLSSINRTLRGDVEIVIGKALEKEKDRRYQSALDFASDIERYLNDEPIVARPPSVAYQFRKFARRNKALVGGVAATFIVLLAGLIAATTLYLQAEEARAEAVTARDAEAEQRRIAEEREREAVAARDEAETAKEAEAQRAEELEKVAAFQESQLADIDTAMMGINLRLGLIEKRRSFLEGRGMDEEQIAEALAELESSLTGVNFTNVALEALDENIFERALEAIEQDFADQPEIKARLLQTVADTMRELGLFDRAVQPQAEALKIRRYVLGDDHPDTLASMNNMGVLYQWQGNLTEAELYLREALEGRRRVFGVHHPETVTSINNVGVLLRQRGALTDAESYLREALDARRRIIGDEHSDTLEIANNIGIVLLRQVKLAEAEHYFREVLEGYRRALGNEHRNTLIAIQNMGHVLQEQGRFAESEPYLREALDGMSRVLGNEHPNSLAVVVNMGALLQQQGKLAEAERYHGRAISGFRRLFGDGHRNTLISMVHMVALLRQQERFTEAEPYMRRAVDGFRNLLGNDHAETVGAISNLGVLLRDLGQLEEAERLNAEAVESARRVLPDGHWHTAILLGHHAQTLTAMARFAEAEERVLEAHAILESALGQDHVHTIAFIRQHADLYDAWHAAESDAGHDAKAVEWRSKLPASDDADADGSGDGESGD